MAKNEGTIVQDPIFSIGPYATTDIQQQGGFRVVTTLADMYAIGIEEGVLEPDGISSGKRKADMLVAVIEEGKLYQLRISGFLDLGNAERLEALGDNVYWEEASLGGGSVGTTIVDFRFEELSNELTIETTEGTFSVNVAQLNQPQLVTSVNTKTGAVVLTKADIGLGNVNNTTDLNKPISTATQAALDLKANKTEVGDTLTGVTLNPATKVLTVATDKTSRTVDLSPLVTAQSVTSVNTKTGAVVLVKGDVGLGNVDNTSDLQKPISIATQTALDLKADAANVITRQNFAQTFVDVQDGGSQLNPVIGATGNLILYLSNGVVQPWHIFPGAVGLDQLSETVKTLLNKAAGDTIQGFQLQGNTLTITTDLGTQSVDLSTLTGSSGGGQQAAPALQKLIGTLDATLSGPIPAGALGVLALVVRNGYTFLSQDYTVNTQAGTFTIINDTQGLVAGDAYEVIGIMSAPESGSGAPAPSAPILITQDDNLNTATFQKADGTVITDYEYTIDGGQTATICNASQLTTEGIVISVTDTDISIDIVGLRRKAVGPSPASNWRFNLYPFYRATVQTYKPHTDAAFAYSGTLWQTIDADKTYNPDPGGIVTLQFTRGIRIVYPSFVAGQEYEIKVNGVSVKTGVTVGNTLLYEVYPNTDTVKTLQLIHVGPARDMGFGGAYFFN